MILKQYYLGCLAHASYLVADETSGSAAVVDPQGKVVATRGSTVFQSFPPGKKKVDGIEFSLREKNAAPGSCRVISVNAGDAPN